MGEISEKVLNECLSSTGRDFQNLSVTKLSEEYQDGQYYVGYEIYVMLGHSLEEKTEILQVKGTCIITPYDDEDGYYMGDLGDEAETRISVDDSNLPGDVLDNWILKIEAWIDKDTAQYYLDQPEDQRSNVLSELCQKNLSQ